MNRIAGLAVAFVLMAGCTSVQTTPRIVDTTPEPADRSPSPQLTASPATTAAVRPTPPPIGTPRPSPQATIGRIYLYTQPSYGYTRGQVIQVVENSGDTWIDVSDDGTSYIVRAPDGGITVSGSFSIACGKRLAPRTGGYLLGQFFSENGRASDFDRVEAATSYTEVDPAEELFSVVATKVRNQRLDGVEVVGELVNNATDRRDVRVSAVFLNARQEPIGIAWTYAYRVDANGGRRAFRAQSYFPSDITPIDTTLYFTEG